MSKFLSVKHLLISKQTGSLSWAIEKIDFWGVHFGGSPGRWHPQTMSKYLSVTYLIISKQTGTLSWAIQKIDFWGSIWGIPGGKVAPPNYVKIFVCEISADIKKHWHPSLSHSKNWFWGGPFGGPWRGMWHPQTMSKYLSVEYLLIAKQTGILTWAIQKADFWGSIWGDPRGGGTPKLCQNICLLNIYWYQKK